MLLGMSFLLTIVLTFTMTMAWFFDSDWANNGVTMAGSVGIQIRDYQHTTTSGTGALNFEISTDLAYPGQAIQVSAEVYNDGGKSGLASGSACYVRAHFKVYTNIGQDGLVDDPLTEDIDESKLESEMNAQSLYNFLAGVIETQNTTQNLDYCWNYYKAPATTLRDSGIATNDLSYYLDGVKSSTPYGSTLTDKGYFYLCYRKGETFTQKIKSTAEGAKDTDTVEQSVTTTDTKVLMPLQVNENSVFLWNSTFIIPWTLTNYSADKRIFVAVTFQAIQTFIPEMMDDGTISTAANNQLLPSECTYDDTSVTTVFNSCKFADLDIPDDVKDFGAGVETDTSWTNPT